MQLILLASVPHTGTNTMRALIGSHIDRSVELPAAVKSGKLLRRDAGDDWGISASGTTLVQTHFRPEHMPVIEALALSWPLIVLLRDPMLTVISAAQRDRNPEKRDWTAYVEQWRLLAECIDAFRDVYDPMYVPVDLKADADWPAENAGRDDTLKNVYAAGDLEAVRKRIPREVEALERLTPVLRPMLEREGYRDLIWWR